MIEADQSNFEKVLNFLVKKQFGSEVWEDSLLLYTKESWFYGIKSLLESSVCGGILVEILPRVNSEESIM